MQYQPFPLDTILLGDSKAIRTLRAQVRDAASSSLPVLLYGPAGSGKELTAWAIHAASHRHGPFVPFTMSRMAEFIARDRDGDSAPTVGVLPADIREFSDGTVFLDNIAKLRASSQTLLVQALKSGLFRYSRVTDGASVGMRLIAATSIPPKDLLRQEDFQEPLLRRLGRMTIAVPALAERRKDIPILTLYFLSLLPASQRPLGCTAGAMRQLQTFDWPENVRELKRVVTAAAKLAPGEMLDEMAIEFARKTTSSRQTPPRPTPLTPVVDDAPPPISTSIEADELVARSYQAAKRTVARWFHSPKPTPHYPRLIPPRPRVP